MRSNFTFVVGSASRPFGTNIVFRHLKLLICTTPMDELTKLDYPEEMGLEALDGWMRLGISHNFCSAL